jgi:hypothetical protein
MFMNAAASIASNQGCGCAEIATGRDPLSITFRHCGRPNPSCDCGAEDAELGN